MGFELTAATSSLLLENALRTAEPETVARAEPCHCLPRKFQLELARIQSNLNRPVIQTSSNFHPALKVTMRPSTATVPKHNNITDSTSH